MSYLLENTIKLVFEHKTSRSISSKIKIKKKIESLIESGELQKSYDEYKVGKDDIYIYSHDKIEFNSDTEINFSNDIVFNFLIFIFSKSDIIDSFINENSTRNLIYASILYSCKIGEPIDLSLLEEEDEDFISIALFNIMENGHSDILINFIKSKLFINFESEIKTISIHACENYYMCKEILDKLLILESSVDDVFEYFDVYSSEDLLHQFISSGKVSSRAIDKKFESVALNTSLAKIFLSYGVSKKVFKDVYFLLCSNTTDLIGTVESEKYINGIKYYEGEYISYFYKLDRDHLFSRFINCTMMNEEIFNEGIMLLSEDFCFMPALLVHRFIDHDIFTEKTKNNERLYEASQIAKEEIQIETSNKVTILDEDDLFEVDKQSNNISTDYFDDMEGPLENSNYIESSKNILIGASPKTEDLNVLLMNGITTIINLTSDRDYIIPDQLTYFQFPIRSGQGPSQKSLKEIFDVISGVLDLEQKIFIHCDNGHGRSGVLAAILYGKIEEKEACESIQHIEICRNSRTYKVENFVPTPETNAQVNFVGKILGVSTKSILPDRSNKDWVKKLKEIKKNQSQF